MKFFDKVRAALQRFMSGRYGSDPLGKALLIAYLVLFLLATFTGLSILSLLSAVLLALALFRMLSRDTQKRASENLKYLALRDKVTRECTQFVARVKGSREYKYFKCPKCGKRMRLPRKVGSVTVHCRECGHSFDQKA